MMSESADRGTARLCRERILGPLRRAVATLGVAALLAATFARPAAAQAQDTAGAPLRNDAPLVFLDCNRCDMAHVRQTVTFVNHVRDRGPAQVHVLVTDEQTGGGGRRYTFAFIGQQRFAGLDQTLTYTSPPNATSAEERDGVTGAIRLGLVAYVAQTSLAPRMQVAFDGATDAAPAAVSDPWRNWTFEVYGGGNANSESTQSAWNARYGFYANRVTEQWKVRLRPYFNHNVRRIQPQEGDEIRTDQRRHGFESYIIRSLGPNFGAGVFAEYITTTIDNLNHGVTVTPAIEYSIFPYGEASRRQITFTYRVGYELADYIEETIYEKTEEALLNQALEGAVRVRQPWGSIFAALSGSRYFHDGDHYRITFNSNVSFRITQGVSLNVGGSYQRIHDQLALPRRGASLEDILLQQRRLATAYRSTFNVGLSYTFGSIFTNVVNPRL